MSHKHKILLVVQGEGRGHMTQAITAAQFLQNHGHEVCHVIIGTSQFRQIPDFIKKRFEGRLTEVSSPNFIRGKEEKSIKILKSITYNLINFKWFLKSIKTIDRIVKKEAPTLILNFYEPVFGLYTLFKRNKIPVISIAHQYIFLHPDFKFYKKDFWDILAIKILTKISAIGSEKRLALHIEKWKNTKETKVIPPLLRKEILSAEPIDNGHLCIYLLNHGYSKEITAWHHQNRNWEIHVFWDKKNAPKSMKVNENLYFHQLNDQIFMDKLINCHALLSTSGFESICEAAYLGKPVFMVPVSGHFEQHMNALMFTKAGYGMWSDRFEIDKFAGFINVFEKQADVKNWFQSSEHLFIKEIENLKV